MVADANTVSAALGSQCLFKFKNAGSKIHINSVFGSVSGREQTDVVLANKMVSSRIVRTGNTVEPGFKYFDITASAHAVNLQEVPKGPGDGVSVIYDANAAVYGMVSTGGWLYSDGFSGCVWFVYRDMNNRVHGVHAARASGILEDPRDFYRRTGGKLLYVFDTAGRMSTAARMGQFAVMLCHVGQASLTCWAVARDGQDKVTEILDERTIPNWRRFELKDPAILKTSSAPPAPPTKTGFMSALKRFGRG